MSLKLTQDFTDQDGLTFTYDYSDLDGFSPYSVVDYYSSSFVTKKTNNVSLMYDWNRNEKTAVSCGLTGTTTTIITTVICTKWTGP